MSDDNVSDEHLADLQHKCRSIVCDLRTKRNGSPGAATEHALITQKICDICAAKHINIVFEQLEKETKELAAWAELKRQESSDHFMKVRDSSIMEIDAMRSAVDLTHNPCEAPQHVRKARRLNGS